MEEQRAMAVAEKLLKQANNASKMIWVTFRKEGIHCYPGADTDPKLATGDWDDVSFKRWLQRLYENSVLELDHKSCEMISNNLFLQIATRYPRRNIWINVSEDGENGSFIKYHKEN